MCGIVGYVGRKDGARILVEGLRCLEYRGYDSAGIALHTGSSAARPAAASGHGIEIVRAVGKLANLEAALKKTPLNGTTGFGHTRWATHGRPTAANPPPHPPATAPALDPQTIQNQCPP